MPTDRPTLEPPQGKSSVPFALGMLGLVLFLALIGAGIFLPVYLKSNQNALNTDCVSSQKDLARGLTLYAMDFDGLLPEDKIWADAIKTNVYPESFHCPMDKNYSEGSSSYAFSAVLSKAFLDGIKNPNQQPMVFDAGNGPWNLSGGADLMPTPGRHQDTGTGNIIAFADGSVKFVKDGSH